MHFRVRNNVVQVIRTTYDPETQKAKGEIVARMSRANPQISDEMRQSLSAAELTEAQRWIDGQHRLERLSAEHAAWTLADQIDQAARWIEETDDLAAAGSLMAQAQQSWLHLRVVAKRRQLGD